MLAAVGIVVVTAVAGVEVTSQPKFCNSCHIMEPYYVSWTEDRHGDVSCVECHIEPGADNFIRAKLNGLGQVVDDALNRTSTKPSASVSDLSCGRGGCHDIDELKTKETKTEQFIFKHGKHLGRTYRGIEIHCTTCHSHVRGENHFEVNTNACVTCHLSGSSNGVVTLASDATAKAPEIEATPLSITSNAHWTPETIAPIDCQKCHEPPREPFAHSGLVVDHSEYLSYGASCESCHHGVTARPAPIDDGQCLACHVYGAEKVDTIESIHRLHTVGEHKVECFNCHGVTRHGPVAQEMSMSFDRVDCYDCHAGQHAVQKATYLQAEDQSKIDFTKPSAISPMFLVHVDCTGCHVEPRPLEINPNSGATVARAVATACDMCHQPGLGDQMIPMWQRDTHELYDQVITLLPREANRWDADCPDAAPLLDEARRLLELVRLDGSWGVHNPQYTSQLIERARTSVLAARGLCRSEEDAGR